MSIRDLSWHERCLCRQQALLTAKRRPFAKPSVARRYSRDRVVDVQHIRLEVFINYEARTIQGLCATRLVPLNDGLRWVEFDSRELSIEEVSLEGEGPLSFALSEEKLRIDLGKPRGPKETLNVHIRYHGQPRRGLYFISPNEAYPQKHPQVWSQGQDEDARYWFPCYDYPNQKATSELLATVPKGWFALSNGRLLERRDEDAASFFHWYHDVPHVTYLITLAAGEYVALEELHGELPVVAYVPPGKEEEGKRAFSHTKDMIALFEERTGRKYPYAKYAQIVVEDFIFGGMENTSATTLTDLALQDETASKERSSDPLVAHELAHQWFGDLITCRDWSHAWLNEGFATYCEALWEERARGEDEMRYYLYEMMQSYFSEDRERYRRPIVSQKYLDPLDLFDRHLYEKGGLVLHMLRVLLGEDLFWKSIRLYVEKNAQKNATTHDLLRAIEEATGKNMEWFFDQWVFGAGFPEYEVSYQWEPEEKIASVSVKQTQEEKDETPLFKMPITLAFVSEEDKVQRFSVTVEKREHTFYFPLAEEPKDFRFDPKNSIIKQAKVKKPRAMLLYQLKNDPDVCGRIFAAEILGDLSDLGSISALGEALKDDAFWGVRAEVAQVLGKIRSERTRDLLIEALSQEASPKVTRAISGALGEFRGDTEVEEALLLFLQKDPGYFTRGESARSLGRIRTEKAISGIDLALRQDSWGDVIRTKALDGLGHLRDEAGIERAKTHSRYGHKPQGRAAAVLTLARLGEEFPEHRSDILDHLIELLEKPGFRVHLALTGALGKLKEGRAIPALERLAAQHLDGRIRRAVREAVDDIREGRKVDDSLRSLRDDFEKLREENRSLRDRLDKIEAHPTEKPKP